MAVKDKLSKEVEEQLQSFANDVSIQIEDKLTQILCAAILKESTEKNINLSEQIHQLEKKTIKLEEQLDVERSKNVNSEATLKTHDEVSVTKISELEQENIYIKQQLVSEIDKQKQTQVDKQSKIKIAPDENELREQQQKITALNEKLAVFVTQEQSLTKQLNISEKDLALSQAKHQQEIDQLENKNQELSDSLIAKQADIKSYQTEISSLESQVTSAHQEQESILNRFNANRDKQEKDNNKVRETIKYLRDENNDMINQNNTQKEELTERIGELEHKLTEYRLKFEYAQKQLTQNS